MMQKQPTSQLCFIFPVEEMTKKIERANRTPIILKDRENIAQTLPILLPHQLDNVWRAEKRFFSPAPAQMDGLSKGMMFTDGTGTGKTFVGLGIVTRFKRMGLKDQLIVVPTESKVRDWQADAKPFGMNLYQLKSIKDPGPEGGISITTFANFRSNESILTRALRKPFDLVTYDECHNLVSNQMGSFTRAVNMHQRLTYAPDQARVIAREKFMTMMARDMKEYKRVSAKTLELIEEEAQRLIDATRVIFLSATPFAYHKSLLYTDGYLFKIRQGENGRAGEAYNNFFVDNFGYRVRYNKLTEPEAQVDISMLERQFHTKLVAAGCVSSTRLRLSQDYSREFVLIDDAMGMLIDEGYQIASDRNAFEYLSQVVTEKFSFLYKNQLLEAIKVKRSLPRIQQHLDLGRKVVVFHSYVNSLPSHPFDFSDEKYWPPKLSKLRIGGDIDRFHAKYPQYKNMDLSGLTNPVTTIKDAFGDRAVIFNGNIPAKARMEARKLFNKDDSGKDIFVSQIQAGGAGISLHDTTNEKPRVMIIAALPFRPSEATQCEGRIYRVGQRSNATLEYPCLHLNFEKTAFGQKINERIGTVETLAFGEQSRNLRVSFKEAYKNPTTDPPHLGQGVGSRDADMEFETIDPYALAIKLYFNRSKQKNKSYTAEDYFATPEPLGFKMVEWAYSNPNDQMLEPSAGHGAIGRFFPEHCKNKFIEPSYDLRADLAINITGDIIPGTFEEYHIVNKHHSIIMNPPFGSSGKTAMEHMEKACLHINDSGRIIVILPSGPAMDTRLEKWKQGKESKEFVIVAKILLPAVTFARAGTEVQTQLLVIDRQYHVGVRTELERRPALDLTHIEDINDLFKAIQDLSMPPRLKANLDDGTGIGYIQNSDKAQVVSNIHTKFGYRLWTVRLLKSLDTTTFLLAEREAKKLGGYYSDYNRNGAIPGFIFRSQDPAQQLTNYINVL